VLAVESVLVHMAAKPSAVRSWASAVEWLPDLAAELVWEAIAQELQVRPRAARARTGYLLTGLRPDLAERIGPLAETTSRTWFGPRGKPLRHDSRWQIADALLPFDPRTLGPVA